MANAKHNYSGVLSITGLILVLVFARGFDALIAYLVKRNSQTFSLPYISCGLMSSLPSSWLLFYYYCSGLCSTERREQFGSQLSFY